MNNSIGGRTYTITIRGQNMRIAYNKVLVSKDTEKKIRKMFFQKIEMKDICQETGLTERVIRRIINEHKWIQKRIRYYRLLCFLSYKKGITLGEISKRSGVLYYSLANIRKQFGITKSKRIAWNKRITDDIETKFIQEYNDGKTANKIAKKYGFKRGETVLQSLKKHGIARRLPKIVTYYKEDFFEKINSPEKAYVLGLIMTDGYIIRDYSGFGIQLTKTDGYLLKKIALIIGARQGVSKIVCDARRKTIPNARDMTRLSVYNRKIAEDLKMLGVIKNKSKNLRYNKCVPKKYLSHFFRGLIDGDGCIGIGKRYKSICCSLASASGGFINDLLGLKLPAALRLNTSYYSIPNKTIKKCKMYFARVSGGKKETIKFLRWLYKDKGDLYLRRKYAKVQNQIN